VHHDSELVAVYINEGHVPKDGGKPWKHLDPRCPKLLALEARAYVAKRVLNIDGSKPIERHVRRRCPIGSMKVGHSSTSLSLLGCGRPNVCSD
jgi:hypothetical protein